MSINEIIKKHLPITNQNFSRVTTKTTHCQNIYYGYCQDCKEHKTKLCNEKLIFQNIKQVSNYKYFYSNKTKSIATIEDFYASELNKSFSKERFELIYKSNYEFEFDNIRRLASHYFEVAGL